MEKLSTEKIINKLGKMWSTNNYDGYLALFTEDALVTHPYFSQPVNVRVAMEVINAALSGYTKIVGQELIKGNGSGEDDVILVKYQETGDQIGSKLRYLGAMMVRLFIKDHLIYRSDVEGLVIYPNPSVDVKDKKYTITEYGDISTKEIVEKLSATWETNRIDEFISLFAKDAKIKHVILKDESTPEIIAEVMNCNVKGITKLTDYALVKGDGTGKNDTAEATFVETGTEMGFQPENVGKVMVSIVIKDHKISYLNIYGYKISINM
ncbi:hypothetical protein PV797_02265 [Clostridiaceae bacterium M8S5]|nr:hypothetical protein PV797_02265 [Clostridiaceae bacterium M8S5]